MPISEPLIVLVSISLFAMLIAHFLAATFEKHKSVHSTHSHFLIAVPVALSKAGSNTICQEHLAVHPRSQWIPILSSISRNVSTLNKNGCWVFMYNLLIPLKRPTHLNAWLWQHRVIIFFLYLSFFHWFFLDLIFIVFVFFVGVFFYSAFIDHRLVDRVLRSSYLIEHLF